MENVIIVETRDIGCQSAPCAQEKKTKPRKQKTPLKTCVTTATKEDIGPLTVQNQNEDKKPLPTCVTTATKEDIGPVIVLSPNENNPEKENVSHAKEMDTGNPNALKRKAVKPKEKKPKKLKLTSVPLKKTIDASTVTNLDMACSNAGNPTIQESPSTTLPTPCSTSEAPCITPENNAIGTGVVKPPNTFADIKVARIKATKTEPILTPELAKAIIVPLGPRGFKNQFVLPAAPWKNDAWTVVVMILGDLQDWMVDDALQMMCGNMYWIPKSMRYSSWVYDQIMEIEEED